MPREDFLESTKRILGQRAAYRCSQPNCGQLTVGPGLADDDVEITGKAAHIYAAATGGPRGQGTLSPEQLRAASNGIWMCGQHADLIDKKSGVRYPPHVVQGWKALHEFRVAYEHSGRTSTFGFVRRLTVHQSPLFESGTEIELGKATFLIGANASGKSALCEWIAAVDTPERLRRWLKPNPVRFEVVFDAPVEHKLTVSTGTGPIKIQLDGSDVAFNHHRISVAFLDNSRERDYEDDLDRLSASLKIDAISTRSVAVLIGSDSLFIKGAEFRQEQDDEQKWRNFLYCKLRNGANVPFRTLSGGEQGRVFLDFAIAQMRSIATFAPGLLIVEWLTLSVDDAGLENYLKFFSSAECMFQTLITLTEPNPLVEGIGWQTYKVRGREGDQLGRVEVVTFEAAATSG